LPPFLADCCRVWAARWAPRPALVAALYIFSFQSKLRHVLLAATVLFANSEWVGATCFITKKNVYRILNPIDRVTHTHTHPFNGPFSGTTRVSRYQKCRTNLDFTEARDNEWQWHQLGPIQVCTLLHTDNHTSIPPFSFLQAGCPSCCPTNSVKAR